MKNRVNLYHPEFHPKLQLLTLPVVIGCWVLSLCVCGLIYVFLANQQQALKADLTKVQHNKQQQELLVNELQNALDNRKVDPKLLKQVQESQQLIDLKKRVLNELTAQEQLKSKGYSNLMLDLASYNQNGLWLQRITLDGARVVIEGAATDSTLVPKWLSFIGKTDYFNGQKFADTRLYRDAEQQLNFAISTGNPELQEKEGSNE
ncbi:hypothetical protein [uncultured Paraglaciecola sp.]|uniref:PilN domain-containing protein n=1 Tax=uncultured Paraglaciecola sp. TaxID=1765024 RepID=UPI002611CA8A|nr:hypothetical protein [uncultured Paraglaciecola sp.]